MKLNIFKDSIIIEEYENNIQEIKDNQWTTSLGAVCRLYEK